MVSFEVKINHNPFSAGAPLGSSLGRFNWVVQKNEATLHFPKYLENY